jgi:protein gp37
MIRAHLGMDDAMCWPLPNVWLGVTVENQQTADERIPLLLQTPAAVRFLSCEPLLENIDIGEAIATAFCTKCSASFDNGEWNEERELEECPSCGQSSIMDFQFTTHSNKIDWVIIGGESGPGARPCNVEWIRSLVQQCKAAGVSAWVKQMGSNAYSPSNPMWDNGITGKGTDPSEWPEDLRVQEFPFTEEAIAA